MITKHDLDELSEHTAQAPLDAPHQEPPAHDPPPGSAVPAEGGRHASAPQQSSSAALASAADPLSDLLEQITALRARVEAEVPRAVAGRVDDSYDILLALKQESSKLNDTLYALWLRHACASLNQP